jgi:heme/copper-type cytochrome/quinol oxidase subunit 1
MGITYYLIPLIFRRKIVGFKWAKMQPWMFFIGIALLSISMIVLGQMGVPRRHWDNTFSGGPFTYNFNPAVDFFWALMMLGGVLAFLATVIWILIVVVQYFLDPRSMVRLICNFQFLLLHLLQKHTKDLKHPVLLYLQLYFYWFSWHSSSLTGNGLPLPGM